MKYPVGRPFIPREAEDLVLQCIRSNWVSAGPMVKRFELLLADILGVHHDRVVMTSSGTTALHLALAALGIGAGDEVIIPDLTYVATRNAVLYTGATPVAVDIDPTTYCIDVRRIPEVITRRTRAILPVHLYGLAADMTAIANIAHEHNLYVVEDAAEGFYGTYEGNRYGTLGDTACLSFFANKLVATGEGGACITRTRETALRVRSLAGMCNDPNRRYNHLGVGFNYRPTDLAAAIGIPQLETIASQVARRRQVFEWYQARLAGHVSWPRPLENTTLAPWLFTCELPANVSRDKVMTLMAAEGVETRPTFVPMHEQHPHVTRTGYDRWGAYVFPPNFPVSDRVSRQGISLPTYVGLSEDDVDRIVDSFLFVMEEATCV